MQHVPEPKNKLSSKEMSGIQRFYSRPCVSNDNPYSESIFRTIKYRPEYPEKGFETIESASMRFVLYYWILMGYHLTISIIKDFFFKLLKIMPIVNI
ncbi:transposase family protein [Cerasibacillus terrae]|uniref:Transposase family protein n=1 Tax=Cerasibacillus terrae TaxID=2498845 RepID=A0A5C8NGS1_9BACI|nr:transposase family protein [Cerasibacillus terrae]